MPNTERDRRHPDAIRRPEIKDFCCADRSTIVLRGVHAQERGGGIGSTEERSPTREGGAD